MKKQNRIVNDPNEIGKKYLIKEESEEAKLDGDVMTKVHNIMNELTRTFHNRFPKAQPIGWSFGIAFEDNRGDAFDYFSVSLCDLENANEKAADMLGTDIINRMKLAYGHEVAKVRQDLKGENQ
jgi:hypothetical protein